MHSDANSYWLLGHSNNLTTGLIQWKVMCSSVCIISLIKTTRGADSLTEQIYHYYSIDSPSK